MGKLLFLIFILFVVGCESGPLIKPDRKPSLKRARKIAETYCNAKVKFEGVQLDKAFPISNVAPVYPRAALENWLEGCVILGFDIDQNGRTKNVKVLKSFPHMWGFERAAVESILKRRYFPTPKVNVATKIHFKVEARRPL